MASIVIRQTALNPLLTGTLLYLLTRAPSQYRDPALELVHSALAALPAAIGLTLPRVLTGLKTLLTLGLVRQANIALNAWSFTSWRVFADKGRWKWSQEVAVVTGGCMGIGKGVVDELHARGLRVAILDIAECPKEYQNKDRILYVKCDITSPTAIKEAAAKVRARFGHPSVVVNNAGGSSNMTVLEISHEKLEMLMKLNLMSHWWMIQEFLPNMLKQDKGHIVGVASMASFIGMPGIAPYAAQKAGVLAFQETMNAELKHVYRKHGILITTVHPAYVDTPLVRAHTAETGTSFPQGSVTIQSIGKTITAQVLSCRGGQIIVPDRWHVKIGTLLRAMPNWLQEGMRDMAMTTQENTIPFLRKRIAGQY